MHLITVAEQTARILFCSRIEILIKSSHSQLAAGSDDWISYSFVVHILRLDVGYAWRNWKGVRNKKGNKRGSQSVHKCANGTGCRNQNLHPQSIRSILLISSSIQLCLI